VSDSAVYTFEYIYIYIYIYYMYTWAGQRSRYIDWLRAGLSGDRIPVWDEIFGNCPDRPWGPPSILYNGNWLFPGGRERPGRDADPSPLSSAVGHERVELYLFFPYGPYGLYRASVPVQVCTLPTYMYTNILLLLTEIEL